jgi:hypothetical protein
MLYRISHNFLSQLNESLNKLRENKTNPVIVVDGYIVTSREAGKLPQSIFQAAGNSRTS